MRGYTLQDIDVMVASANTQLDESKATLTQSLASLTTLRTVLLADMQRSSNVPSYRARVRAIDALIAKIRPFTV